jgi:hypothetical protein
MSEPVYAEYELMRFMQKAFCVYYVDHPEQCLQCRQVRQCHEAENIIRNALLKIETMIGKRHEPL